MFFDIQTFILVYIFIGYVVMGIMGAMSDSKMSSLTFVLIIAIWPICLIAMIFGAIYSMCVLLKLNILNNINNKKGSG